MEQSPLFDPGEDDPPGPAPLPPQAPAGLRLDHGFLSREDETELLARLQGLAVSEARYKGWTARRRVASFGGSYDFERQRLETAAPLPEALRPLRDRVAAWSGVEAARLADALVAEYRPGTPLGWHRDVPDFEDVFGVSLSGDAVLRFRPWPATVRDPRGFALPVPARSIYALRGPARWAWQHAVPPVPALRWSITFRTRRSR